MTTQLLDIIETRKATAVRRPANTRIESDSRQAEYPVANRMYLRVKVAGEWLIALGLLLASAPLLVVLAAAVKWTSPGPIFYAQTRLGRNGRLYRIYKLRTMVHNAEAGTGPVWAARKDTRITGIGRVLRDTHLDELPQLWNVLRGEMGLIGPRPERPELAANITKKIPEFPERLGVRPGVTGLAQMLLPADDPNDIELKGLRKKLSLDLYYIGNVSFMMDVKIAISTPCYFMAALVDAVRGKLLNPCMKLAEEVCEEGQ